MSNYTESKKNLNAIRNEYRSTGDVIFKAAIQMVVEHGQANFNDEEWYAEAINSINARHDEVEKQGKVMIISRGFEIAIVECAKRLATVDAYDLMIYAQREVFWSNQGIDYQRAIELLQGCMLVILDDAYEHEYVRSAFIDEVGFENDELDELGYGFLLDFDEYDE
jgi:hypothetical protein